MSAFRRVHTALRQHVGNTQTYNRLRRANTYWSLLTHRPHERDYYAFPLIARAQGVFLDVGANAGQTAAAVAGLLPRHDLVCFEPNPNLHGELAWLQKRIGARMTIKGCGLGDAPGHLTLHVPHAGDLAYEARASILRSEAQAHAARLAAELGRKVTLKAQAVSVVTLDSLALAPDIIKIDVEGFEASVLAGAEATIMTHQPIILLEHNDGAALCKAWLAARGYSFLHFDADTKTFAETIPGSLNYFAVPESRRPHL